MINFKDASSISVRDNKKFVTMAVNNTIVLGKNTITFQLDKVIITMVIRPLDDPT